MNNENLCVAATSVSATDNLLLINLIGSVRIISIRTSQQRTVIAGVLRVTETSEYASGVPSRRIVGDVAIGKAGL